MNLLFPFPMIHLSPSREILECITGGPETEHGLRHMGRGRGVLICVCLQQKMLLLGSMSPFYQICLNSSIQGTEGEALFFQNWFHPKRKFKVKKKKSERR